ncbi:MAG: aminotransferase class I/II-fold pyridoxal phosphate-dependent enzyme [Alicyclobacillus sp.]|nr:aminotransferase class I/II-fold pyridoxal phosphate-dependent enzyme [Alicyclobacillus sp.]
MADGYTSRLAADLAPGDTPLWTALQAVVQVDRWPFHVPGHHQGRLLPSTFSGWLGAAAKLDLTELPGLDNYHQPVDCLYTSQQLAARFYGSEGCVYSVNGASACLMGALTALASGGKVIFAGTFHQSAWRGLIWADGEAVMVPPQFDAARAVTGPPSLPDVAAALRRHPDARLLYVTSPTYAGVVAPVQALAELAHAHGVPLLVDEAHGAHLGLDPALPPHSIACGADVVVHSVHKLLPGLTQTAWLHWQGPRIDGPRLAEAVRMFHTTSPSYLLLAALDVVQAWLYREGAAAAQRALAAVAPVWAAYPSHRLDDPLRHWWPAPTPGASQELAATLRAHGIFPEYADPLGVLSLFGLATDERGVTRYLSVLQAAESAGTGSLSTGEPSRSPALGLPGTLARLLAAAAATPMQERPRTVWQAARRWQPLARSAGEVAAAWVTPYPPGVPVVLPGQRLSADVCRDLAALSAAGAELHGVVDGHVCVLA